MPSLGFSKDSLQVQQVHLKRSKWMSTWFFANCLCAKRDVRSRYDPNTRSWTKCHFTDQALWLCKTEAADLKLSCNWPHDASKQCFLFSHMNLLLWRSIWQIELSTSTNNMRQLKVLDKSNSTSGFCLPHLHCRWLVRIPSVIDIKFQHSPNRQCLNYPPPNRYACFGNCNIYEQFLT